MQCSEHSFHDQWVLLTSFSILCSVMGLRVRGLKQNKLFIPQLI